MRVAEILAAPGPALLVLERWVNDGSPSGYTAVHSVSAGTHPVTGPPTFELPRVTVNGGAIRWIGAPGTRVPAPAESDQQVLPLHPDMFSAPAMTSWHPHLKSRGSWPAVPSSSGRTVFVLEGGAPGWCVKLHYDALLGRFRRILDQRRIDASLDTSADLEKSLPRFPARLAFLPEHGAWVASHPSLEHSFGALARSLVPLPRRPRPVALVPLFSLFSSDRRQPSERPLIAQIFGDRADAQAAVLHELIDPILEGFAFLAFELGLVPEWNAQNLLIELGLDGTPGRIVFRDLQGCYRDLARRPAHLPVPPTGAYKVLTGGGDEEDARARRQRSYLFDFKLGEYVLSPLLMAAAQLGPRDLALLQQEVRARMHVHLQAAALPVGYWPADRVWYRQSAGVSAKGPAFFELRSDPPYR